VIDTTGLQVFYVLTFELLPRRRKAYHIEQSVSPEHLKRFRENALLDVSRGAIPITADGCSTVMKTILRVH